MLVSFFLKQLHRIDQTGPNFTRGLWQSGVQFLDQHLLSIILFWQIRNNFWQCPLDGKVQFICVIGKETYFAVNLRLK